MQTAHTIIPKASRTISRNNTKKTGLLPQMRLFSEPREGKGIFTAGG